MTSSVELRHGLVEALVRTGTLRSGPVKAAFGAVPRERFVPQLAATRGLAAVYADEALVVQERDGVPTSSSSQPAIMAEMLEALDLRPGHRVLEVGLGTGYNAALLSTLAGPDGAVTSVDIDESLVANATRALTTGGYRVATATGDGRLGWPPRAPYDRIIVTASTPRLPRAWWDQLAPGGLLVVPMRLGALHCVPVFTRTPTGFASVRVIQGGFMALRDGPAAAGDGQPLVTVRAAIAGQPAVDITTGGPGLATLTATARRTLVGNLLARPTRRTAGRYPAWSVIWHTALTSDPRRQVSLFGTPGWGFGLVDLASGGCGVLVSQARDGQAPATALLSFGNATKVRAELLDHVRAWRAAGAPDQAELAVEVGYHDLAAPAPGWALRTVVEGDQDISAGWPASPASEPALGPSAAGRGTAASPSAAGPSAAGRSTAAGRSAASLSAPAPADPGSARRSS